MARSSGGKRKKKKSKKISKVDDKPRRSTLTPQERERVQNMHEILGEVWEPFKTAAGAVRGLEADPAPWLELEFWDSLAEAFVRYYGKAIKLQVDVGRLLRDQRAAANAAAAAEPLLLGEISTTAEGISQKSSDETHCRTNEDGDAEQVDQEGVPAATDAAKGDLFGAGGSVEVEMLPMNRVSHLGRAERVSIIRQTASLAKREAVLQRLFYLAQAPAQELEQLVAGVKELGNNSSAAAIRDVNLLETWQSVREERAAAWDAATEQVRLAATDVEQSERIAGDRASDASTTEDESDDAAAASQPVENGHGEQAN